MEHYRIIRLIALSLAFLLAFLAIGCTKPEQPEPGQKDETVSQPDPNGEATPSEPANEDPSEDATYGNAPVTDVKTTPWDQRKYSDTFRRWATEAALWTAAKCRMAPEEKAVVTDVRFINLGMAWDEAMESSHTLGLYEVDYLLYGYGVRTVNLPTVSIVKAPDGGYFSEDDAAKALMLLYFYSDSRKRSYVCAVDFFSEADVREAAKKNGSANDADPLTPYRQYVSDLYGLFRECWQTQDGAFFALKYDMADPVTSFDPEFALYNEAGLPVAEIRCDENLAEFFTEGREENITPGLLYGAGSHSDVCTVTYPGIRVDCELVSITGRMIVGSIECTRSDLHTSRNIFVGSARSEVEAAYPDGTYVKDGMRTSSPENAEYYLYEPDVAKGIRFYLEADRVSKIEIYYVSD